MHFFITSRSVVSSPQTTTTISSNRCNESTEIGATTTSSIVALLRRRRRSTGRRAYVEVGFRICLAKLGSTMTTFVDNDAQDEDVVPQVGRRRRRSETWTVETVVYVDDTMTDRYGDDVSHYVLCIMNMVKLIS